MSKFSLLGTFIIIAVATVVIWFLIPSGSEQPVAQPKHPKSSVVNANAENQKTNINEGKGAKSAVSKSKKNKLDTDSLRKLVMDDAKDYAKLLSNPENYVAMKAVVKRLILNKDQEFFRNQTILPDVRQKMLDLLADLRLEQVEAEGVANGTDIESERAALAAMVALEIEYKQKLFETLGSEIASRYDHYAKNKECWSAVDRYVLVTADALSDDQKYAIACIMSENKTTSLIDLKDKIIPLLNSEQKNVFDAYVEEERIVIIGKGIDREQTERALERRRQTNKKAGKRR